MHVLVLKQVITLFELNPSQALGLDLDRHIALDAGAGTGKTMVMATRYVQHLLASDQRATRLLPPGPRKIQAGAGNLAAPKSERTSLDKWKGLLPAEVVAITFTRKAATELRGRIRRELTRHRSAPVSPDDRDGIHDSRLKSDADVEMLVSAIEDAPIATIDSFLASLVAPWIASLSDDPPRQQMADERLPLLHDEAIASAWRLQNAIDGIEAGLSGNIEEFLAARGRLSIVLGGQRTTSTILKGMLKRSLFVEESYQRSRRRIGGDGEADAAELDDLFIEPVRDSLAGFAETLFEAVAKWSDIWLDGGAHFVTQADCESGMTRYRFIRHLVECGLPGDSIARLQWIWLVTIAMSTPENSVKPDPRCLTHGRPPASKSWPAGVMTKTKVKVLDNDVKNMICEAAKNCAEEIRELLSTPVGLLVRRLGRASHLLNPVIDDPIPIHGQEVFTTRVDIEPTNRTPKGGSRSTPELEIRTMEDLFILHKGVRQILSRMKTREGLHHYDDMHELAEDLLLTRCPTICRRWYPRKVVWALDNLSSQPWEDDHLNLARQHAKDHPKVLADLDRRITILYDIRRLYRAFIIDEFQDTNPQHLRLLARLWGRRRLEPGEPEPPAGDWDPTVCIVGDMKQSIYRFRQAEVRVMRRVVETVRSINRHELQYESRLDGLRRVDAGRDPRPSDGGEGDSATFVQASVRSLSKGSDQTWISFRKGDDGKSLGEEAALRRAEGHIEMATNHRTLPGLLNLMNGVFSDVFSPQHHLFPGPWHARHQRLNAGRKSDKMGRLDWLLPLTDGDEPRPSNPIDPIDPFLHAGSSSRERTIDLMVRRIEALIRNRPAKILDQINGTQMDLGDESEDIRPRDILILVHARTSIPQIIAAFEQRGLPVAADRQGALLHRPAILALMAALRALSNQDDKAAILALARSTTVGLNDQEVTTLIQSKSDQGDWYSHLVEQMPIANIKSLLTQCRELCSDGTPFTALDAIVDYSDLLISHSRTSDRRDVESWLQMVRSIGEEVGKDSALIMERLERYHSLRRDGPTGNESTVSDAINIMTIHAAKGLEAPIVVLFDPFAIGRSDAQMMAREKVLVTPDLVAGRIDPWPGAKKPDSGTWELALLIEDGQQRAERRRHLYVALTRARDRLILAGGPPDASIEGDGRIRIPTHKDRRDSLGDMFLSGLIGMLDSPSFEDNALIIDSESMSRTPIPDQLGLEGISIFHHSDCFEEVSRTSPLTQIINRIDLFGKVSTQEKTTRIRKINHALSLSAHGLNLYQPQPYRGSFNPKLWPSPQEFGTVYHRLFEIGLANPADENSELESTWLHKNEDRLSDIKTITQVLDESSIIGTDIRKRCRERLLNLAQSARQGKLGLLASGVAVDGYRVEGLRTELPFYLRHDIEPENWSRNLWTPSGDVCVAELSKVEVRFEGRADLVLALKDEQGKKWLQVVDAKTTGCLGDQEHSILNQHQRAEIIAEHRLQLALYSHALKIGEMQKPEISRREILPPAILWAATGEMVEMSLNEFELASSDLIVRIEEVAKESAGVSES